jgi:LCP family protein required for cell wall assembly
VSTLLLPDAERPPARRASRRRGLRGWLGRNKALSILLALVLAVGLPVAGLVVYTHPQLAEIPTFDFDLDRTGRPPATPGDALNFLLIGVDDPDGSDTGPSVFSALESADWPEGLFRSDAIMVLHLPADRNTAQVVSIPRDSYVDVEGYGRTKINAAFSYGGPELLARTVEDLTRLRIDHAVVVDFEGLAAIADVVGGVDIYLADDWFNAVRDTTWHRGEHHFTGEEALAYVRERHGLLRGDLDRVQRQQNFLRAVLGEVASAGTLANPFRLARLVGRLSDVVAVDEHLTPGRIQRLALASRGVRVGDLTFATVPVTGTPTIDGASVVTIDEALTRRMFGALGDDDLVGWLADHDTDVLPGERGVR